MTKPFETRVAGAPISWGACEVPGWGYQLEPRRVLREMHELGLTATEFGPVGFLPEDPHALTTMLAEHRLHAVGGFLPVLLHEPQSDPLPSVDDFIDTCLETGAGVVVLAAYTGVEGYDERPVLSESGWRVLQENVDRIDEHARSRGITAALHPHVGTVVETYDDVQRVLAGSRVGLCIDTGHLLVGGTDPFELTRDHVDRVVHVHLKDVRRPLAERVRNGELTYGEAIARRLYTPLGEGDIEVASLVRLLEEHGYSGWYVLEQDVMLDAEPDGEGPVADVRTSLEYLREVAS